MQLTFQINNFKQAFTIVVAFMLGLYAYSQENETLRDSTSTTFSFNKMSLPDPGSIESKYEYIPSIDKYKYSKSLQEYDISYPMYLSPKEFHEMVRKVNMRKYFKEKMDAISGKGEDSEEKRKNLLPIYYVNSNFFESIFGSNEIEVIPQGSVEVDLGALYNRQDNPAFSPRNQSNFTFDFDQRISLSLQGNVGTRLSVIANYDTESTFDFQNQLKLQYNPTEDDIIQAIEVGNVTMPVNSSLIQGAQSLFGFKTIMQFGKTTVTGVFSEQRSDSKSVTVQGGGTIEDFEIFALDYDENRHYFLSQYFRDHYDEALEQYPFINSSIQITRIQVWVTNNANSASGLTNARNIVALQDLGESDITKTGIQETDFIISTNELPDNGNNKLDPARIETGTGYLNDAIRDVGLLTQAFTINGVEEGTDYSKLENARLLTENQYTLNTQLGYITLNQKLNSDEILGVAFQYTKGGQVYQVGEFANDGVSSTSTEVTVVDDVALSSTQALVVKLLKSSITSVDEPVWDLMMKNIYNLGAYRLSQADFRMNILYTDPSPVNYIRDVNSNEIISEDPEDETPTLLKIFNLDKLNANNDPVEGGDGYFDYYDGITIDTDNGRLIFTTVEPFGSHLFDVLGNGTETYSDVTTYNDNQAKYVFNQLYSETKTEAEQSQADKNKFQIKGRYKTTSQNGISIGAYNIPRGSVTVSAGGRILQEGIDYTVNYQLGRVEILDEALLSSNTPIDISTENNAIFGQQTKRFSGVNVEHKVSEDFVLGATLINIKERPLTQKSSFNYEPINNTIVGLNANFSTEVPLLTRLVNKLPNIDTEVPSNLSFRGEFAYLFANAPDAAEFEGEVTSYLDDFEGAQTSINMSTPLSWELSSVPEGYETAESGPESGYRRAALSWYKIDPIFYSNQSPDEIDDEEISRPETRLVSVNEIFEETQVDVSTTSLGLYTLDLHYRPAERGPYNYNPTLGSAEDNFAGVTRSLSTTNFEQSNVEFIEFWLMDPYTRTTDVDQNDDGVSDGSFTNLGYEESTNTGRLIFNIGNISEDVLADGRKQYENGLPETATSYVLGNTNDDYRDDAYGRTPTNQSLTYAFDNEGGDRNNQDAGFDGLKDAQEIEAFGTQFGEDPSNDNYQYFLQATGNIEDRYLNYNGVDGDAPVEVTDEDRGRTTLPTVEDVNRDNTMNTINQYFEYTVDISPDDFTTDNPLITDELVTTVNTPDGGSINVRWLQFRVPLNDGSVNRFNRTESVRTSSANEPSDLRSANFMRMYMTGFNDDMLFRLGSLDLIRGDYRTYNEEPSATLDTGGLNNSFVEADDPTLFVVNSVSVEENSDFYKLPPGVIREQLNSNNNLLLQDEGSISLTVNDLQGPSTTNAIDADDVEGDARAVYKNFNVDMRQYENLKIFLHAQEVPGSTLDDGELAAIVRIGTDLTENFYQIEWPLEVSTSYATSEMVWPEANRLEVPLDFLQKVKVKSNSDRAQGVTSSEDLVFYNDGLTISNTASQTPGEMRVGIKGNPSFGNVRIILLGVKNNTQDETSLASGQVWFNEMRLTGLKNQGGWAAVANMDANVADFARMSASGKRSTIGFGGVEQGPAERSIEDVRQYDFTTNVSLGQLLPKKWGVRVPVTYSRSEQLITPQYDPLNDDLVYQDVLAEAVDQDAYEEQSTQYTKRQSVSVIGLRKERKSEKTPLPLDISNFSVSGTYNQTDYRDFELEESLNQSVNLTANYNYAFVPLKFEPFKDSKFFKSKKYLKLLKDFNLSPLPTNISASSNLSRSFNKQLFRDVTLTEESIQTPALTQRNYLFNWQYNIQYNLTKSLNFNFTSSINRVVKNYFEEDGSVDESIGLWDGLSDIGDPNTLNQGLRLNYDLPINKIPLLSFVKSSYSYSGDFQWQRGSDVYRNLEVETGELDDDGNEITEIYDLGNSIQNSMSHRLNSSFDMNKFYRSIGLVKKTSNRRKKKKKKSKKADPVSKKKAAASKTGKSSLSKRRRLKPHIKAYNTLITGLTAVKRLSVNYQQDAGTVLPGYTNSIGVLGSLKPTTAFTFGSQNDVRDEAARMGWLTIYDQFNEQYQQRESQRLDIQANVDIVKGLKIDVKANRAISETYSENYIVDAATNQYQSLTPYTFGNYSISSLLIKTAFNSSTEDMSETFENFKSNRQVIANRLAGPGAVDSDGDGYPDGYGPTNQAVVLPAFLSAYSGSDVNNVSLNAFREVPLPNWTLKYTGFMRNKWIKKRFKRVSLSHSYRSNYTINNFQTNLDYDPAAIGDDQFDTAGNYKNELVFGNINLTEQFSPLVKIDFETKSSLKISTEIRKDRALSFSFDNNLLTEVQGNEFVVGLGYRFKDIQFKTRLGGSGRKRIIKSDLNFKADFSLRRNETLVRYLDVNNSQVTAGQDIYSIRLTSDYALSKNLTALFYYDHSFSEFAVSTAYPQTNIRSGFTLRYNFGN